MLQDIHLLQLLGRACLLSTEVQAHTSKRLSKGRLLFASRCASEQTPSTVATCSVTCCFMLAPHHAAVLNSKSDGSSTLVCRLAHKLD